ncbi:MAG: heme-binding protein [Pseudomonadota bacterium]
MKKSAATVILSLALGGCSVVGIRDAYEQPSYTVVETIDENVEIRRYTSRLAAEVTVATADPDQGSREAFGLLFDYLSGANAPEAKIEMTSPVAMARAGAKITMTTPVETAVEGQGLTMRFFLPSSFTEEKAPQPTDSRVSIVSLPAQTLAALRYSGSRDSEHAAEKKAQLRNTLAASAWQPAGEAVSYYYDPPWTLPWFRRNEAIAPVTRD